MIRVFIYSVLLLFSMLLEATVIQAPLTLTLLITFSVLEKRGWLLILGFFSGFILDSLTFRLLGSSSIFFIIVLGILFLYGKKFETHHIGFGIFFITLCSLLYGFIFGNPQPFLAALFAVIFGFVSLGFTQFLASKMTTQQGFLA